MTNSLLFSNADQQIFFLSYTFIFPKLFKLPERVLQIKKIAVQNILLVEKVWFTENSVFIFTTWIFSILFKKFS